MLIYGGKGWIGSQFCKLLDDCKFILGNSRVDNTEELEKEIIKYNPTHIVSFIGRTHGKIGDEYYSTIDYLEQRGKLKDNIRDNLFSPISLALIWQKWDIHFTYIGTGCIFKYDETHLFGKEEKGFTEDNIPNFFGSSYSIVKGFTDRLIHQLKNTLNLRIRMPITGEDHPRNFITKITTYEKICSIPNSMTVLPELLPIVLDMMKKRLTGTFNLTNPGLISHNEILTLYKELVDPNFKWKNFTIEKQAKILDSERSNNFLNTTKIENLYNIKNIKESIEDLLKNYKKRDKSTKHTIKFKNSSDTVY